MSRKFITCILKWPLCRYFSKRTAELNFFLFFMCMVLIFPIRQITEKYNYPISPYCFPHLFSYLYFQLGFFAAVLYFFSDVPFMNEWEMNRVLRMGRLKWALSQIWTIIVNSYMIILNLIILTWIPLLGAMEWKNDWGKLLYTLAVKGNEEIAFGISYRILLYYTPWQAMGLCFLIGGAVICFLGLFMFAVGLWVNRISALVSATVIISFSVIAENLVNMNNNVQLWYLSPISWLRIDYIEREYIRGLPNFEYIITALGITLLSCIFLILIRIRKIGFNWSKEEL